MSSSSPITAGASSSSSSSKSTSEKHDVFLSFRGEDTRKTFISHLVSALRRYQIETYFDEDTLERGEEISQSLRDGIQSSKISIIVLSQNYASSSWCLGELLHILECQERNKQVVIPIFYNVEPSDVRKQKGTYAAAIKEHEKRQKDRMEIVQKWKDALTKSASLSGWDSKATRTESELVEAIAQDILQKLNRNSSSDDSKGLIGIEEHIEKIKLLLNSGSSKVHIVGLWGMGGLGKTTIAEAVFYRLYHQFEGRCFLPNVREDSGKLGLINLRNKLLNDLLKGENINLGTSCLPNFVKDRLSRKKVLIVLDDVNDSEQLKYLIDDTGDWFGQESIIIITTRDAQVLKGREVAVYEVRELDYDEALQLFKLEAFKGKSPSTDYIKLSYKVVRYAGGNPLAIKILGSHLNGLSPENTSNWEMILDVLKEECCDKMMEILKISFLGLHETERAIFLDIACFFKGKHRDFVENILDGCDFQASVRIKCLIEKSLITISSNHVIWMHDLVQEMGWNIVVQKSENLGERSRLWIAEDVYHVLNNNEGTKQIEGIFLNLSEIDEKLHLTPGVFQNMHKLRLLKIFYTHYDDRSKVYLSQDLQSLPDRLSYLDWESCPLKRFPSKFKPRNLSELRMPHSEIEQLWDGDQDLKNLKSIDLSHSIHLTKFPDLSRAPNLEIINLEHCTNLSQFPWHSLQNLGKLDDLNLACCEILSIPADRIDGRTLRSLSLRGCSKFFTLPMMLTTSLTSLNLSSTPIKHLPSSIDSLNSLSELDLRDCKSLTNIPSSMHKLESLYSLHLSGCSSLGTFPKLPRNIRNINLSKTAIREVLSSSIEYCFSLDSITMTDCKRLESLQTNSLYKLESLYALYLSGCSSLDTFPKLPRNITHIDLSKTAIKEVHPSSFEDCLCLQSIDMTHCKRLESLPSWIFKLKSLSDLDVSCCSKLKNLVEISEDVESSYSFKAEIQDWEKFPLVVSMNRTGIRQLPSWIGNLTRVNVLRMSGCENLEFDNICNMKSLEGLELCCSKLEYLPPTIGNLLSLGFLELIDSNISEIPPDIKRLSKLYRLKIKNCKKIEYLPELPLSLQHLEATSCSSLVSAPNRALAQGFWDATDITRIEDDCSMFCDCLKLDENARYNIIADFQFRVLRMARLNEDWNFTNVNTCCPCPTGDEIPEWFTYSREGSSVDFELPPQWYNSNFSGFAVCAVATDSHSDSKNLQLCCKLDLKPINGDSFEWAFNRVQSELGPIPTFDSNHLFMWYWPDGHSDYLDVVEAKFNFFFKEYSNDFDFINCGDPGFEECVESSRKIKRCGVRILYRQDIPEQFQSAAITDQPEPSAGRTMVSDTEAPHPKRLKRSNSL